VVPGTGDSFWTVTHAEDFARPFARLLGRPAALGEAFHITADQAWTWNEILRAVAAAIGVEQPDFRHVPVETLIQHRPEWRGPQLGDKCASVVFDNSKVKAVVGHYPTAVTPWEGMRRVAERYPPSDAIDPEIDAVLDRVVGMSPGTP
jgi:nucleoside-diphosphate-sugar epimerase